MTDFNFLGNINSIYALVGVLLMLLFQMWIKYREDKRYREEQTKIDEKEREEKKESDRLYREQKEKMHIENMQAQKKLIESLHERLSINDDLTHKHTEHIIDIAETIDKTRKTKRATKYKDEYNDIYKKNIGKK